MKIRYIGCDDAAMDLFESQYVTPEGMCYNSYLLEDEKVAVIDSVDARCTAQWLGNLEAALEGRQPDYLVQHHMEPDHSGSIVAALEKYPSMKLVCSSAAARYLPQFFEGFDMSRVMTVGEGDVLDLGGGKAAGEGDSLAPGSGMVAGEGDSLAPGRGSLRFIAAPFVHWPEVLMSYCPDLKTLFSADGFGKFGVYGADPDDWACEARRYYFNICGKYGAQVAKVLDKAAALDIRKICPLHGPVLEGEKLAEALRLYSIWSRYGVETPGVCIAHASIHGGTAAAAEKLREMLLEAGCPKVAITDLCRDDMAEAIEDAFRYGTLVCCASSYDGDVFPPMHEFLWKLSIKGYQKRRIAFVENGTWGPCAARTMKALVEKMSDIEILDPVVTLRSALKSSDLAALRQLAGKIIGEGVSDF